MTTPIILSIDGNIGAGKSTFLNQLKKQFPKIHYIEEPVDTWTKFVNEEGESLLEVFYKDRKRWSYTFQNCAFLTRVRAITKSISDWKKLCQLNPSEAENNIFITERSVATDFHVFAKMLYQDGSLNKMEWDMYRNWYHFLFTDCRISGIIYITCDVDKCLQRISIRNRQGEEGIPLEYLTQLHKAHEDWIDNTDIPVFKIDTNEKDFTKNDDELFKDINDKLRHFIKNV
jgi:deoxyadenosine/deoxycytidine kinase